MAASCSPNGSGDVCNLDARPAFTWIRFGRLLQCVQSVVGDFHRPHDEHLSLVCDGECTVCMVKPMLAGSNLLRSFEADSGVKCSEGSQTTSSSTDRTRCSAPTVCLSSSMAARKVNRENGRMGQLNLSCAFFFALVPEVPARAPKLSVTRICGIYCNTQQHELEKEDGILYTN